MVENCLDVRLPENVVVPHFDRFLTSDVTYESLTYSARFRRNNSAVRLADGAYGLIKAIILVKINCICDAGCDCLCTAVVLINLVKFDERIIRDAQLNISSEVFMHRVTVTNQMVGRLVTALERKCVRVDFDRNTFLTPVPNIVETD